MILVGFYAISQIPFCLNFASVSVKVRSCNFLTNYANLLSICFDNHVFPYTTVKTVKCICLLICFLIESLRFAFSCKKFCCLPV